MPPTCLSAEELQRQLHGSLSPTESDALERHLLGCPGCGEKLAQLAQADPLVALARRSLSQQATPVDSETLRHLQDELKALTTLYATEKNEAAVAELAQLFGPPDEPGDLGRLGPYRVLAVLGQGGMGVVFEARHVALKRDAALKMMLPAIAAHSQSKDRFLREAQAMAAVTHPNVVPIYDFGEEKGVPFLAMPLLRGESLESRLGRKPPVRLDEALAIIRAVARGLQAAHDCGLIHRDIKPLNIWLESAAAGVHVLLLDFGLARQQEAAGLTETGVLVGTRSYLAPELFHGKPADARSDLYSLGIVLYRLLTEHYPGSIEPKPPHVLAPKVPAGLSQLTMRLLAKEPDQRPPSAAAFLADLDQLSRTSRTRRLVLAAVLLVLLVGGATAYLLNQPRRSETTEVSSPRQVLGPSDVLRLIADDLETLPVAERAQQRYLTAPQPSRRLDAALQQLGAFVPPPRQDAKFKSRAGGALFRFDLRDLGWTPGNWTTLAERGYPYAIDYSEGSAEIASAAIRLRLVGGATVILRADWLLRVVAQPGEPLALPMKPWPPRLQLVDEVVRELAERRVDLDTAAAELGLSDVAPLLQALRKNEEKTREFRLTPLLEGGSLSRHDWEASVDPRSPFQYLARLLGQGVPLR